MSAIKLKENEECNVEFTHFRTKEPSSLYVAMNPMTGDWMEIHGRGKSSTAYVSTKAMAVKLANNIVKKSTEHGMPCKVTIQPRTILPNA